MTQGVLDVVPKALRVETRTGGRAVDGARSTGTGRAAPATMVSERRDLHARVAEG